MTDPAASDRPSRWAASLGELTDSLDTGSGLKVEGMLTRMVGMTLEAEGCQAAIGDICLVETPDGNRVETEVVGFADERIFLMPTGDTRGLVPNARVIPTGKKSRIPVGDRLLGRVIDGAARPLDGKGRLSAADEVSIAGEPINPLARRPIREPLDVGVQAINGLLTVGRGQRMGLFAGSGVGKSSLLGMMTRYTEAEVIVVGLIGERGREVHEFVHEILGDEGLARAVVVAAPADASPVERIHGAMLATRIAEYYRDIGRDVLLLMDSLTRFAQAQREVALAIGEPPATKGYPPSVFARLPQLVERAGNSDSETGSMTAFYTVLVEGDDQNDPIADASRAILDGHIVLSREIAERGRYPAIDIEASVSRVMPSIVDGDQMDLARQFREFMATYSQNRDLISVGAYEQGSDPRVDAAIALQPDLEAYLGQDMQTAVSLEESVDNLFRVLQQ